MHTHTHKPTVKCQKMCCIKTNPYDGEMAPKGHIRPLSVRTHGASATPQPSTAFLCYWEKATNSHAQSKAGTPRAAQLLASQRSVCLLPAVSGEAVLAMMGFPAIPNITDAKLTSQIRRF